MVKIRQADWRDREIVRILREMTFTPISLDGGLYELFHWPIFHQQLAMVNGQVAGWISTVLSNGSTADSQGTAVFPQYRRQGVASHLWFMQLHDLLSMGYTTVDTIIHTGNSDGLNFVTKHFKQDGIPIKEVADNLTFRYYRADIEPLIENLRSQCHVPYLRTITSKEHLRRKVDQVQQFYTRLKTWQALVDARNACRQEGY